MERSAVFLVTNSDMTITEVAQRYGYGDSSVYTKAFKRHYGVSPSDYRNSKK